VPENDARYSERVYDHVVNGVGQFEVPLAPSTSLHLSRACRDAHREHAVADNLLSL